MRAGSPVVSLHALRRTFGGDAAAQKLKWLSAIEAQPRLSARELVLLQATLEFMRAYPDNAMVRRSCQRVIAGLRGRVQTSRRLGASPTLANSGVPGCVHSYAYSFETLAHLVCRFPHSIEIDWNEVEDETRLNSTLELLLSGLENEAMEDVSMWWGEWMEQVRPPGFASDLQFMLSLLQRSHFGAHEQGNLYENLNLQIRYRLDSPGAGRCEVQLPVERVVYQKRDIARESFKLAPRIRASLRKTPPLGTTTGKALIDVAIRALASRDLEIHPLLYANPRDVVLVQAQRGVQVALVGVLPEQRSALTSLYFFLVLKNGVPVAYGPASLFLGSCEMGINLFPEFRGGEIRFVYAQVMRLLRHLLGAEYFYLTSYGMGEGNEEAIQSGAFWFYRKLGFSASNPRIEELARSEEARMRAEPGYRSNVRMLRRLSFTEAHLDLSGGRCRRFPYGKLGLAVSRYIALRFEGDRNAAMQQCTREVRRALGAAALNGFSDEARRMLREFSPVLSMIGDLPRWGQRDRTLLARIIAGKAARSEAAACVAMKKHRRLSRALWALVDDGSTAKKEARRG